MKKHDKIKSEILSSPGTVNVPAVVKHWDSYFCLIQKPETFTLKRYLKPGSSETLFSVNISRLQAYEILCSWKRSDPARKRPKELVRVNGTFEGIRWADTYFRPDSIKKNRTF